MLNSTLEVFMLKKRVASGLEEIALLLELAGESTFRIRAYQNAARTIKSLPVDIEEIIGDGSLQDIKGIGRHIAERIMELAENETPPYLQELRSRFPAGVLELFRIPGLGPKKIRVLMDELDVRSTGELEYACRENRLLDLPGFGARTQEKILNGIRNLSNYAGRFLWHYVSAEAESLAGQLRKVKGVYAVEIAGSLRRKKETVKDIDLVAAGESGPLMDAIESHELVMGVSARGQTKLAARLKSGVNLDLRVVPRESFPYALQHFTGSRDHNVKLRGRAQSMGLKSNEYGIFRGEVNIPCASEADIYSSLGLDYVEPELREGMEEIEAAGSHSLPDLVKEKDIAGTLHLHTVASDGSATLEQMAAAAQALGFTYMGITEHSQSARYARGLEPERLEAEGERIEELNATLERFRILKGIESDILPDGSLDYPDKILEGFDFVIGSVHSGFGMPEKEMTARICTALKNPHLDILGHPTGRLLLTREPYAVDMQRVLECAAENGKAVELNAHPYRLDLDWRLMPMAKSLGIKIAICPDAHSTEELSYTLSGVGIARKGWLTKGDVLNCMSADELMGYFSK